MQCHCESFFCKGFTIKYPWFDNCGGIYETLYVCIFTLHKDNYSALSTALVTQNDYRFSVVYVDLATSYLIISHKFSQTAGKILKIMKKTSVQYFDRYIYCNK